MLSALHFEAAAAVRRERPGRTDVACFVGAVARRAEGVPPAGALRHLRELGLVDGPHPVPPERLDALRHLPVIVESWEAFDQLFEWENRPVGGDRGERCATWLGAAVREYFAQGGSRAVVVSTGEPAPYVGNEEDATARAARLAELMPALGSAGRPFLAHEPAEWRGVEHIYGLREVSHLLLPDLVELFADAPAPPTPEVEAAVHPEVFVECSASAAEPSADDVAMRLSPPRLSAEGFAGWAAAVDGVRAFLARHRRDVLLLTALPLPSADATLARRDWISFLERSGVLPGEGGGAESALVQSVWPWIRTPDSTALPGGIAPADGLLAGILAANALARGTHRSVAGTRLARVRALSPEVGEPASGDSPVARVARRVCVLARSNEGHLLLSDVTGSADPAWRQGGSSRLLAALLRAAARFGETVVFEQNGPELWRRVRTGVEDLLRDYHAAGAFGADRPEDAYQVRCDAGTMTANDLDGGRLRVEVSVLPAAAVERITVSLELGADRRGDPLAEVA